MNFSEGRYFQAAKAGNPTIPAYVAIKQWKEIEKKRKLNMEVRCDNLMLLQKPKSLSISKSVR